MSELITMTNITGGTQVVEDLSAGTDARRVEEQAETIRTLTAANAALTQRCEKLAGALKQYADETQWERALDGAWNKDRWSADENGYELARAALHGAPHGQGG